jgi:hypothetical protein
MHNEKEEDSAEQGKDYIWIEGGVIEKEIERQATIHGKGSHVEGAIEMMKRAEFTPQKRHQTTTDNKEADLG